MASEHMNPAALDSYSTALVLLPPESVQLSVNTLRSANDKAFPRWTAHITMLVPFVEPKSLSSTARLLREALSRTPVAPFSLTLDQVSRFTQRQYSTVYLSPSKKGASEIHALWKVLSRAMAYKGRPFVPHMTIGQSAHRKEDVGILDAKGWRLCQTDLTWNVASVVLLVKDELDDGRMKIFEEISLSPMDSVLPRTLIVSESSRTFHFDGVAWTSGTLSPAVPTPFHNFTVATFNVLHDAEYPTFSRFSQIKETIVSTQADILCLQEATDEFLSLLLRDNSIQQSWTWCSRAANGPMESERNIVILAKEAFPFSWERVVLGGKHKTASVLSIPVIHPVVQLQTTLIVAAVHLTAGLSSESVKTKSDEFQSLRSHLQARYRDDEWVIIGDTNFPDDFYPPPTTAHRLLDVWSSLHEDTSTYSATYDPLRNSLALATTRGDHLPHRYDRVYVKSGGLLEPERIHLAGLPEAGQQPSSDHWALVAKFSFRCGERPLQQPITPDVDGPITERLDICDPSPSSVNSEIAVFLQSEGEIPSQTHQRRKENAIDALCQLIGASRGERSIGPSTLPSSPELLTATASPVKLIVTPVGSYALGVDISASDLDCLVVGNIGISTFWTLARSKLHNHRTSLASDGQPSLKLRRYVKDAAVRMMELEFGDIKIDLQYCPSAKVVDHWHELGSLPPEDSLFNLSASSLRVLNAHRDILNLSRIIPSLPVFQTVHRFIKVLCVRHGIFGSRFGYMGGFHITLLLAHIATSGHEFTTATDLLRAFFRTYAQFDWSTQIVSLSSRQHTYQRNPREPMVILSVERPVINVSAAANHHTVHVIRQVFAETWRRISLDASWPDICGDVSGQIHTFLRAYTIYLKIEVNIWGSSCMRGRALVGFLESRIVNLLVRLHTAAPGCMAQLWPNRFVEGRLDSSPSSTVQAFYLIGLSVRQPITKTVLAAFEDDIHSHTHYYDPAEAYICISQADPSQLGDSIVVDKHVWSDGGIDESDEEMDQAVEIEDPETDEATVTSTTTIKKRQSSKTPTPHVPAEKLRTSVDVYNRLRWDPELDQDDYVIGYEDRFEGVKEMPIRSWKREVEDEAFVPFHRVVHFRRKSDGLKVWDRRSKTDLVFGSGLP